jgi:Na+/H+ antiporter NhaD and related arsenite permeases
MCAACALALAAVCAVRPSASKVLACVDARVLSQLFCLMLTILAFRSIRVLDALAAGVLKLCASVRGLFFALTGLVFVISMAVTNDVALLTFVPFTFIVCREANSGSVSPVVTPRMVAVLVVLETLAANLGSCITPMGNPQNVFLFSFYNMAPSAFFSATLLIGVPSIVLLCAAVLHETKNAGKIAVRLGNVSVESFPKCAVYAAVLTVNLLAVFRVVDYRAALAATVLAVSVCNARLFLRVDYGLLLTFVGFFIFTGVISDIPAVSGWLRSILNKPESVYAAGILVSQVISNVPAALLLSGFTRNAAELLLGVNVGGLGTLIASLASVISYKLFRSEYEPAQNAGYFKIFTIYNVIFLIILSAAVWTFAFWL